MEAPKEDVSLLMVFAGPAGSGKTTLCDRMVEQLEDVERVVTCTTRQPREGEKDGVDYHFFEDRQFEQAIESGAFLEWAEVHSNRYGVLKSSIREKLEANIDIVINVDVQGVENIKIAAAEDETLAKRLVSIFIKPADLEVVRERLRGRGKDSEEEIEHRIETAKREVEKWSEFDYVIVTGTKDQDFQSVLSIWKAEKLRSFRRQPPVST